MTTFTSDDREEAYKKIVEAAPFQPGYEDAVPIPFAGWVNTAPPHIVDSGASVMGMNANELADQLERDVKDFFPIPDEICLRAIAMLRQQQAEIAALRRHRAWIEETAVKELTDEEIMALWKPMPDTKVYVRDLYAFARAILRKAQEK